MLGSDKGGNLNASPGPKPDVSAHACLVTLRLDGKHVVFGSVVEGMDVVRKMEAKGCGSGKTTAKLVIKDCGEL